MHTIFELLEAGLNDEPRLIFFSSWKIQTATLWFCSRKRWNSGLLRYFWSTCYQRSKLFFFFFFFSNVTRNLPCIFKFNFSWSNLHVVHMKSDGLVWCHHRRYLWRSCSKIPLLRPPKIKTFYLLTTLFWKFQLFFSSFSTPWLETTFGTVQKWSLRPLLDSLKGGLNIGILLYMTKDHFGQSQRWS